MKAPFSSYLEKITPALCEVVSSLGKSYDYVSLLSSDSVGFRIIVNRRTVTVNNETMTTERGSVVRVYKDGLYSEYSFNYFDPECPEKTVKEAKAALDAQLSVLRACQTDIYQTKALPDEKQEGIWEFEADILPETADEGALIALMQGIVDKAMADCKDLVDCQVTAQSTHISKLFLTKNKNLKQSYVYSEGTIVPIGARDGKSSPAYVGVSGRKGPELFEELPEKLPEVLKTVEDLLSADRVTPGEYDIITSPEVTGLIAHEAFGHGVEMDMFVKNRALGAKYIEKRVGSDLVTMHEGALCAEDVTSFAFDDEGTMAGDVTEIQNGILKTGICDALSAVRLGIQPTGNGKRENFEHKVYTRMTNTMFDSGNDTLEEMIASISYGYFLCGMQSGMEDPKHWGIQCIVERGYEIRDGKLTGKVVAPIVMTGYVPDLLGSVSMVSRDREVFGNGGCGKGHKEWVKVADGGPYLKAKARLG